MMTKYLMTAAAVFTTFAALPAAAEDTGAAPEKKYCQLMEMTGTRLPKKVCLTAKEWKNRHGVDIIALQQKSETSMREKAAGSAS